MKTYHDCIPCFVKQTISVLEMINCNDNDYEKILRTVLQHMSRIDFHLSPPEMARTIHRIIRETSGNADPFSDEKKRDQNLALQVLPQLEQNMLLSDDPFKSAILLAIAGNSIDHGVYHDLSELQVLDALEQGLHVPLIGDTDQFVSAIDQAESILYLADNAGEIVLDKLLLHQLPLEKTTFVVRGGPILNDALMADAEHAGITELVPVIDNGDDAPGTLLKYCSKEFQEKFMHADLIIAKGQGNYETLSDVEGNIFFLLKAKCSVVAKNIGCQIGSAILYHRD
ncbi:MAG: hypothetical protein BA874_00160 [Desulfuromonadales bacterium C00003068]|nr:MAG: hypothetical protein BA874_00160 [Desulfuromonadales bacterium C00003068]